MKKILLSAALLIAAFGANAQDNVKINNLWFSLNEANLTATFESGVYTTYDESDAYSGDIVVPAQVSYQGKNYTVTTVGQYAVNDYDAEVTSVTLPETIITIDKYAFDSSVLKNIVIPNSVKTIGDEAFQYSELQTINLGSGLQSIGSKCFAKCTDLSSVTSLAEVPPTIQDTTFPTDIRSNITLTVPAGKADAYKNNANWSGFKAYVELADPNVGVETIETPSNASTHYFTLQGVEINTPVEGQIVIVRRGSKVSKVVYRNK